MAGSQQRGVAKKAGLQRRDNERGRAANRLPGGIAGVIAAHEEVVLSESLERRYQPFRPMTDRWPATYGHSTITSQPNTNSTNESQTTASLTSAGIRVLSLHPRYRTRGAIDTQFDIATVCRVASPRAQRAACDPRATGVSSKPLHAGAGRHHPLTHTDGLRPDATRLERGVLSC